MKTSHLIIRVVIAYLAIASRTNAQVRQDTLNFGVVKLCRALDTTLILANNTQDSIKIVPSGPKCDCWFDNLAPIQLGPYQTYEMRAYWIFHHAGIVQDTLSWYTASDSLIKRTIIKAQGSGIQYLFLYRPVIDLGKVVSGGEKDSVALVFNGNCDTLFVDSIRLVSSAAFTFDSTIIPKRMPFSFPPNQNLMFRFSFRARNLDPDSATILVYATDRWIDSVSQIKIFANTAIRSSVDETVLGSSNYMLIVDANSGEIWFDNRTGDVLPKVTASFYDLAGRLMNKQDIGSITGEQKTAIVQHAMAGCYFVRITSEGRTLSSHSIVIPFK